MEQLIKSNKRYILTLFERSWGEVDWILPVLYKIKQLNHQRYNIIVIFLKEWRLFNQTVTSTTLYDELINIADEIIYIDDEKINYVPWPTEDVKCIITDQNQTNVKSKLAFYKRYPEAKKIWFPHGIYLNLVQKFNEYRRFNLLEDFSHEYGHDLFLLDTQLGAQHAFGDSPNGKVQIVGSPRFDGWWIKTLLGNEHFRNSIEAQKAKQAKRIFLFTPTTPIRELPLEIFHYVVTSIAEIILSDKDNYLLIRPHPRQPPHQIEQILHNYNSNQWTLSSLHLIQLSALCDMGISVISGAMIDMLFTGKPVIEFAQYIEPTEAMTINEKGHLQTYCTTLNLSVPARTKEQLKALIDHYFYAQDSSIWEQQKRNFREIFTVNDDSSEKAAKAIIACIESDTSQLRIQRSWSPVTEENHFFALNNTVENHNSLHFSLKRIKALSMPVNSIVLKEIANFFKTDILIATGSFNQIFLKEAAWIFKEVHFIESASDLYQPLRFSYLKKYKNINIYHSANILKYTLSKIKGKVLFWLESHETAAMTFKSKTNTPILEELKVIKAFSRQDDVILINNLRYFQPLLTDGVEATKARFYPELQEALNTIHAINRNYLFFVLGDIAIAYQSNHSVTISQGVRASTLSRLFNGENFDLNIVLEAENCIAFNLSKEEKDAIKAIYSDYFTREEPRSGGHYRLWPGLVFLGEGNFVQSEKLFIDAIRRGLNHWRVYWYTALSSYNNKNIKLATEMTLSVLKAAPFYEPAKKLSQQLEKESQC